MVTQPQNPIATKPHDNPTKTLRPQNHFATWHAEPHYHTATWLHNHKAHNQFMTKLTWILCHRKWLTVDPDRDYIETRLLAPCSVPGTQTPLITRATSLKTVAVNVFQVSGLSSRSSRAEADLVTVFLWLVRCFPLTVWLSPEVNSRWLMTGIKQPQPLPTSVAGTTDGLCRGHLAPVRNITVSADWLFPVFTFFTVFTVFSFPSVHGRFLPAGLSLSPLWLIS